MSLRVEYHELAAVDVAEAWEWYEDRQTGLGDRFVVAVEATVRRATRWPNSGSPVAWDATGAVVERKLAMRGFHYVVRYRVRDDLLVVMAVHHQSRRPDFGADRDP